MKKFIFGQRSGIYIIDLEKTADYLNAARDFLMELASKGEGVLFVGTKHQAQEIVKRQAQRCGAFYVTHRWLGGLLTNFATVRKSIERLNAIEKMKEDGTFQALSKKEVAQLTKELEKLKKNFSGILKMEKIPSAVFIVDTKKEDTAVKEAEKLGIPIVALIDTNSNPENIAYPIPGNDDALKSIALIVVLAADSVAEGRKRFLSYLSQEGVKAKKQEPQAQEGGSSEIDETLQEDAEVIEEKAQETEEKAEEAPRKVRAEEGRPDRGAQKKKGNE